MAKLFCKEAEERQIFPNVCFSFRGNNPKRETITTNTTLTTLTPARHEPPI